MAQEPARLGMSEGAYGPPLRPVRTGQGCFARNGQGILEGKAGSPGSTIQDRPPPGGR